MSEYIDIKTESTDDPNVLKLVTNLRLADGGVERYDDAGAMEVGSPLAQTLSYVSGLARLRLQDNQMVVTRVPETPWHVIVADVSAAVKEFFL